MVLTRKPGRGRAAAPAAVEPAWRDSLVDPTRPTLARPGPAHSRSGGRRLPLPPSPEPVPGNGGPGRPRPHRSTPPTASPLGPGPARISPIRPRPACSVPDRLGPAGRPARPDLVLDPPRPAGPGATRPGATRSGPARLGSTRAGSFLLVCERLCLWAVGGAKIRPQRTSNTRQMHVRCASPTHVPSARTQRTYPTHVPDARPQNTSPEHVSRASARPTHARRTSPPHVQCTFSPHAPAARA